MRRYFRLLAVPAVALAAAVLPSAPAWAGSPHFVDGTVTVSRAGDTLTVSGKEAGLGDESQIHIVATAEAACLNPGQNFPQAANKETLGAGADVPVQNGKAYFSLDLTAVFQPPCVPPMSAVFGDVTVTDATNGVTATVPGVF
ncbi:MAG TPA: hypothetical protein VIV12_04295 [Streptosporangiaceae bacterium]